MPDNPADRSFPLRQIAITLVAPLVADANAVAVDAVAPYSINRQSHLGIAGRVNLGSFYTPAKYVALVAEWLGRYGIDETWTIADLSCGYGAFFELADVPDFAKCRFVGNDIDPEAVENARKMFPQASRF